MPTRVYLDNQADKIYEGWLDPVTDCSEQIIPGVARIYPGCNGWLQAGNNVLLWQTHPEILKDHQKMVSDALSYCCQRSCFPCRFCHCSTADCSYWVVHGGSIFHGRYSQDCPFPHKGSWLCSLCWWYIQNRVIVVWEGIEVLLPDIICCNICTSLLRSGSGHYSSDISQDFQHFLKNALPEVIS